MKKLKDWLNRAAQALAGALASTAGKLSWWALIKSLILGSLAGGGLAPLLQYLLLHDKEIFLDPDWASISTALLVFLLSILRHLRPAPAAEDSSPPQ